VIVYNLANLIRRLAVKRFIEGDDRTPSTLFPAMLADYIDEDNPVRVIDAFVDALDLGELGFNGIVPEGRDG
jgi:transposase